MAPNRYYTSYGVSTTFQTGVNNSATTFILNGPLTNWPTSYPFTVLCDWQSGTTPEVCTITQASTFAVPVYRTTPNVQNFTAATSFAVTAASGIEIGRALV